jgi:Tol biopolymer transport system component
MTQSPCLSPDGKHFAFVGYEDGDRSLIIKYSFDSKKITRLGDDNLFDYKYGLRWSPDGKWLSYLTYEEVKVRPEGSLWETDFDKVKQKLLSIK